MYDEEKANDDFFAKELADLCDVYVNDAFSCSHRKHASIDKINNYVFKSTYGLCFEKEYMQIQDLIDKKLSSCIAILGGAKVSTKIGVIENLSKKVDLISNLL